MSDAHLSDYALDALRTRSGGPGGVGAEHLEQCAACAARMAALVEQDAAFAAAHDLEAYADRALRTPPRRAPRPWVWASAAAAAAASVALFFVTVDETRTKGDGAKVELFVMEDGAPRPMHGPVDARAELALRVTPEQPTFARVLWASEDAVDALYPDDVAEAWSVSKAAWLPQKIVLDGAPEPEWLVVVLCAVPFDHAQALAERQAPAECEVESVAVTKR